MNSCGVSVSSTLRYNATRRQAPSSTVKCVSPGKEELTPSIDRFHSHSSLFTQAPTRLRDPSITRTSGEACSRFGPCETRLRTSEPGKVNMRRERSIANAEKFSLKKLLFGGR